MIKKLTMEEKLERICNAIMGFVVGDAVGVPVEFMSKEKIQELNIQGFIETGRSGQQLGSWSDDSSMTLCLIETINEKGIDFDAYSKKIVEWLFNGYMTPNGKAFGVGRSTFFSLGRLRKGISYLESGENGINSNGNGSLMRILPLVFYLNGDRKERYSVIQDCSAITHAHDISKIACCIFAEYFWQLIETNDKLMAYRNMQEEIKKHFSGNEYLQEFDSIVANKLYEKSYESLNGTGYVVNTLETSLYCFINGDSYRDCILKAILVGNDTDTNAAITGSLAGYYYNNVPDEWGKKIVKKEMIEKLILNFTAKCKQ